MPLTKDDLQAIREAIREETAPQFNAINTRLDNLQEDVEEIKESLKEVRVTTNALVEWADNVSVITQVQFPVKKVNNG